MRKLLLIICLFSISFSLFSYSFDVSYADSMVYNDFDFVNVFDDLESSVDLNGKAFDIADYPYREYDNYIYLINFVEYCYSYKESLQSNYGLYIYIYNPRGVAFSEFLNYNTVQMAVAWDSDGNATDYEKFNLVFCTKSDGAYNNLFYKFRVFDRKSDVDGKTILQRVNNIKRRYDISSVELALKGSQNADDYAVGLSFTFSGYADGYGESVYGTSTLTCISSFTFETVEVELHSTFFRTASSDMGKWFQNQMNTVYFAVDDRLFDDYGELVRIKAQWYEYVTNSIIVTSNEYLRDKLLPFLLDYFPDGYRSYIPVPEYVDNTFWDSILDWILGWQGVQNEIYDSGVLQDTFIPYLFDTDTDLFLESDRLAQFVYAHYDKFSYLFMDTVWNGRQIGLNIVDIGRDMKYDMLAYDVQSDWFQAVADYGLFNVLGWFGNSIELGQDYTDVLPIFEVLESHVVGTDKEISERLLIDEHDVDDFKAFYYDAVAHGKKVILFRHSLTPYYAVDVDFTSDINGEASIRDQSAMASTSVFLDFDIIQLTFLDANGYKAIPVVASPIDIFPAITRPLQPIKIPTWLDWIPVIILFVVVVVVGVVLLLAFR